ncbi:MAG: hypothetical protein AAB897_03735 [Patescibacteria group bacterium]
MSASGFRMKSKRRTPQEVRTMGLFRKKGMAEEIVDERERHVSQTRRLIDNDFPWLWAVQPIWIPYSDKPRVTQDLSALGNIISTLASLAREDFGIWIALGNSHEGIGGVWKVARVEAKVAGACWAQEVMRSICCGSLWYVVTVVDNNVTVYRHGEGHYAIEQFVEGIASTFEATNNDAPRVSRYSEFSSVESSI